MRNFGSVLLMLVIFGSSIGLTGCSSSSSNNPVAPPQYADQWFPLAENIATVWENVDYDSMGMAGMMYADTSVAHSRMRGSDMYYDYGVDIGEREAFSDDTICLIMRNDSLFARDFSAGTQPQEVLEAIFPPQSGTTWTSDWNGFPARWIRTGQRVNVSAGTFNNVAVLQIGPTAADSSYKQFWIAEGFGIVLVRMWMDMKVGNQHNVMPMHEMQLRKIIYS
jgi:hypothetical protein